MASPNRLWGRQMESTKEGFEDQTLASIANAVEIEVSVVLGKFAPRMGKPGVMAQGSKLAGALPSHVAGSSRSRQLPLSCRSEFVMKQLQQSVSLYSELQAAPSHLPIQKPGQCAGEVAG